MRSLLFLILLLLNPYTGFPQKHIYGHTTATQQYVISDSTASVDSALVRMLSPYKKGVDTQMQVVIGHTDEPLTKAQPESTLGNFVADAQLVAAQQIDPSVSFAVANYGGIRLAYLAPGDITRGKIYELMPFDNMLAIIEMPGTVVQDMCNSIAARKGWPVSGISFIIKEDKADSVMINGAPLAPGVIYKVAVNDYIARGGDNCTFFTSLRKRFTNVFVRDALISYLTALERVHFPLHPSLDNRIIYAQ